MTAATWLVAAVVSIAGAAALAVWLRPHLQAMDEALTYRTANYAAIDSDTRRIQRQVPDPVHATRRCSLNCEQGRKCTCHQRPAPPRQPPHGRHGQVLDMQEAFRRRCAEVGADAICAAVRDFARGTTTPNPHKPRSRAFVLWVTTYEAKLMELVDQVAAHQAAAENLREEA